MEEEQTVNKLELEACRAFICPKLKLIEVWGRKLGLEDSTLECCRDIAVAYIKKTYRKPEYVSITTVIPAFLYLACLQEEEKITQDRIARVCDSTTATLRKWWQAVAEELNMDKKSLLMLRWRIQHGG